MTRPASYFAPFVSALLVLTVASCDTAAPREPERTENALGGTLSLTGHVVDANGLGLSNVMVTLAGSSQGTRTTDAQGSYAFSNLAAGSYSLRPTFSGCTFNPDVVNLNNLSASAVRDFAGAGSTCGGPGNVNAGATSGALTISGTVTDGAGNRVVGGKIVLGGGVNAVRLTDQTGKYTFHVAAGFYTMTASGACNLTPASTSFSISANRVQNFVGGGATCTMAHPAATSPTGQYLTVSQGTDLLGTTVVRVEPRASAADAQAVLQAIAQETAVAVRSVTIAGYPAIERQVDVPTPEIELPGGPEVESTIGLTTAIAVGSTLVRLESRLPADATSTDINTFFLAGRNFQPDNLSAFTGPPRATVSTSRVTPPARPPAEIQFAPTEVALMGGELQVAASETSKSFVVAGSPTISYSTDDGVTVLYSKLNTVPPAGASFFSSAGDPGIAVGPWDGSTTSPYYYSQAAIVKNGSSTTLPVAAVGLWKSVDEGKTFDPAAAPYPVNCNDSGTCIVPDQPQIAVDTHNRANNSDQIYLAWRNAAPGTAAITLALACSLDGGQSWRFDYTTLGTKNEDHPRLTVADDGSLLVAYELPVTTGATTQIGLRVQKFSSCAQGFVPPAAPSSYPVNIATYAAGGVIAGMPRQPSASFTIAAAADASKIVYVAYALPTSASNDDVHVAQWSETSKTIVKDDVVNTVSSGRRYFPSVCATQSNAFVVWYDRRAGGDKTGYYRRSILNDGASLGHEYNFSGSGREDPQCLAGFPGGGVGNPQAELLCTDLPTNNSLNTGTCQKATCPAGMVVCGSLAPCDFRPGAVGGACTASDETCKVPFNGGIAPGAPTFGDYNEAACARGRMFVAWGTTTAPKDSCTMTGDPCTADSQCCANLCEGGICKSLPGACNPNGGACTQDSDCCNGIKFNPGTCQGGICFRRVGVFTASGGKATIVHIVGTATAKLQDSSGGETTFTKSFDHSVTLGLDGRTGGFTDTIDTSPAGGAAGATFRIQPNDNDVLITGEGEAFGPVALTFANNPPTIVIHPGDTNVFSNGISTNFPATYAPYVGGTFSFSFNMTTTQEP